MCKALKDSNYAIRRRAAEALGSIKDTRAVEPLSEALADSSYEVRRSATQALGNIKDCRVVEPMIRALADSDSGVRCSAAEALGNIEDNRTIEPLKNALADPDHEVRRKSAEALRKIGCKEKEVEDKREQQKPNNLIRWRESGQPQLWVSERRGQWSHEDWLSLLESLKRTQYWPMDPDVIGGVLEQIKRRWREGPKAQKTIKRIFILVNRWPPNDKEFIHEVVNNVRENLGELEEGWDRVFLSEVGKLDFHNNSQVVQFVMVKYYLAEFNNTFGFPVDKLRLTPFEAVMGIRGCAVAELI